MLWTPPADNVKLAWVGVELERRLSNWPEAPDKVKLLVTVWVVPAVKVKVAAAATTFLN